MINKQDTHESTPCPWDFPGVWTCQGQRENLLAAVHFERPETIPMIFHINPASWQHYPQDALQELMAEHPLLFPNFTPAHAPIIPDFSPVQRRDQPYTDPWGCVWHTSEDGITGTVTPLKGVLGTEHPLADWAAFEDYKAPDPDQTDGLAPIDWNRVAQAICESKAQGKLVQTGLRHGHTFLQLCDLRGYMALMYDMADDEPRLWRLIGMLEEFNQSLIQRYVRLGAEWVSYPEDLGMQVGPMIAPRHFRKYIKPSYQRLMRPALDAGCIVHMHSDGDIRLLVDDMVDSGVQVVNLQDLVNGIDWIAARFAGKVCIDLDIDRQEITFGGRPAHIDALIREEVTKLGRKEGGLMMIYGLYPGVPLENVKALMDAMDKYATYYS
jgi:uroporphyrinogen decarboxylase